MKIIIKGEFPSLNEIIKASKSHYMAYANQKKDYTALATIYIKQQVKEIDGLNDWKFVWYRKDRLTDPDNVQVGVKFIYDSLVKNKVIKNDGWNEVNSILHQFKVDKDNPRVEIFVNKAN